ncbi:MAG: NAD(P)/FAD-dependent oxidoreductase [Phycisphaerales bacterium]
MPLSVGIIGCGTAGQAASVFLRSAGHDVTVYERAPELSAVGAGLLVQPTGQRVLHELGVGERLGALASRVERLLGTSPDGRRVLDISYADLSPELVGWGLQRSAIHDALMDRMQEAGVIVRPGVCAVNTMHTVRGASFTDLNGETHGPFDLLIVADGARSVLRGRSGLSRRDRQYAWGALWFIGETSEAIDPAVLRQHYGGTSRMLGFLPSGRAGDGAPERVSLFWSVRIDRASMDSFDDLRAFKAEAIRLAPGVGPFLGQIRKPSQLIVAPYRDAVMRPTHAGRIVYLGDAAHAMSPQLGQGVNLALMDARALANRLGGGGELSKSLAAYERDRRAHVRFYRLASRWLTPLFQSDADALAPMRDAVMERLCRIGYTRDEMLRSLCGAKTGVLPGDVVE